jgi:hypothetical protein
VRSITVGDGSSSRRLRGRESKRRRRTRRHRRIPLGLPSDPIRLIFALEAKRYAKGGVGVHELARLISRLRHREFGVLVTTSYVSRQAYTEIRDDEHPIVVIAAADIVSILKKHGIPDRLAVQAWLQREFPRA